MTGYKDLATLMGTFPELSIFRQFRVLAAKHLLYLQCELSYLEDELNMILKEDGQDPQTASYDRSWWRMHTASSQHGTRQRDKVEQFQAKLRAYCEDLGRS